MEFKNFSLVLLFFLTLSSSLFVSCDGKPTEPEIRAKAKDSKIKVEVKPNSSAKYVFFINTLIGLTSGVTSGLFDYRIYSHRSSVLDLAVNLRRNWIVSGFAERVMSYNVSKIFLNSDPIKPDHSLFVPNFSNKEHYITHDKATNLRSLTSWSSYGVTLGTLFIYNNHYKN